MQRVETGAGSERIKGGVYIRLNMTHICVARRVDGNAMYAQCVLGPLERKPRERTGEKTKNPLRSGMPCEQRSSGHQCRRGRRC